MKKLLLQLSIGMRLKLTVSVLVSIVIIILGVILYGYQKGIIFDQAKQNSYATLEDLIRFTQNEIDASKTKIGFFGQIAVNYFEALGDYKEKSAEKLRFFGYDDRIKEQRALDIPAIYRGMTRLQGDTAIYADFQKMGIEFLLYYQKTDDYWIEILSSHNQEPLKVNATFAYPLDYMGLWKIGDEQDEAVTLSYWAGNKWMQTIRLFMRDKMGKVVGAVVVGIQERDEVKLGQTFLTKHFYKTGICYQLTDNAEVTFHPNLPNFFKSDNSGFKDIIAEKKIDEPSYTSFVDSIGVKKYLFYKYYQANYNSVVVEIPEKEIFTSLYALRAGIIVAVLVLIVCVYLMITYIANTITSRLDKAVDHAKSISSGDLTSTITIDSSDELAELGRALNQMSDVLKETVSGITSTVKTVNGTSNELISISKNIADGANVQASSLEEISSSMEEMTSTVEQNTSNAKKTASISDESAQNIQSSSDVLHESVTYLTEIVSKISLINGISFQTNILALNAAVEAARAGEHGRGFSVVANEVRKLAERSRVAADEIGEVSQKGMSIAKEAGVKLSEHVPMVHQTADLVREITASSIEQSSGIEQINSAIQGLNNITQQNAIEANNITSNISKLSNDSKTLTQLINFFKI